MQEKYKSILIGNQARAKILSGVMKVVEAIAPTLGPSGRSAILPRSYNRGPRIADDGFYEAENVILKDEHERAAADAFKEAISKTNQRVGDGTTSTGVIAGKIIADTFQGLTDDTPSASLGGKKEKDVVVMARDMKLAKDLVVEEIKKVSKPIKTLAELEKIAFISTKEPEISKVVAKMVFEIGRDATGKFIDNHIDVVEGYKGEIETEVVRGMRFPAKLAHRAFINKPERFEMIAEDVAVFITNYKLDNPFEIVALLNNCKVPKLALFAPEFSGGVIKSLVETTKNGLFCYPIKSPSLRTEQLEDLAVYTGATLIDKDTGKKLVNVVAEDLGFAEKIVVKDTENKEDAVLLGGKGEKAKRGDGSLVYERCKVLKKQVEESRNELTRISLEKRIASLSSAVGVIRVGADTDKEGLYLKLKIDDGVYACKAALEEGYVEGGGLCLKKIAEKLPEGVLTEALKAPYELIQENCGGIAIGKDVIDPAKVVRMEVENAVSVAATMLTIDVSIAEKREMSEAEGLELVARSILKGVYFDAKHQSMLKENEDEQEADRMRQFEEIMLRDTG